MELESSKNALVNVHQKCALSIDLFVFLQTLSQRTQTSLRRLQDVLKRLRRLMTKQDVVRTSGKRCRIYVVLKTSDFRRLEDVQFTTSCRRLVYNVLKTSVKRRLCSNVVATSIQRRKKLFFLICTAWNIQKILNFQFRLVFRYGILYKSMDWTGLFMIGTLVMKELTTLSNIFHRIRRQERE